MTIELPNKGQAIDSTYLLKLINTVNELEAKVTARPNNLSTVYVRAENKASQSKSSDLLFSAVQTKITNSNTTAVTEIKQRVPFEISFKNPPIVTATIEVPIGTSITKTSACTLATLRPRQQTLRLSLALWTQAQS